MYNVPAFKITSVLKVKNTIIWYDYVCQGKFIFKHLFLNKYFKIQRANIHFHKKMSSLSTGCAFNYNSSYSVIYVCVCMCVCVTLNTEIVSTPGSHLKVNAASFCSNISKTSVRYGKVSQCPDFRQQKTVGHFPDPNQALFTIAC